MMELFKRLVKDEEGQGLTEYALIIALVSIALIGILSTVFRPALESVFQNISDEL